MIRLSKAKPAAIVMACEKCFKRTRSKDRLTKPLKKALKPQRIGLGDGSTIDLNKNFFAFTKFITDKFEIFIFNRWGELVYSSSSRDFSWNGGLNNSQSQPVPGGSYSYVIRYVSSFHPERGTQERRGGVALLR